MAVDFLFLNTFSLEFTKLYPASVQLQKSPIYCLSWENDFEISFSWWTKLQPKII